MPEIVIHLVPDAGADPAGEAAELAAYLRGEEGVDPVAVEVEQPRLGPAEILAILELANNAIDLTQKLISYLKSRHGQVKDIEVEINGRRVPVQRLTAGERAELQAALASGTSAGGPYVCADPRHGLHRGSACRGESRAAAGTGRMAPPRGRRWLQPAALWLHSVTRR